MLSLGQEACSPSVVARATNFLPEMMFAKEREEAHIVLFPTGE